MISQLEIKWHGRTFPVDLKEEEYDTCTVGELKEICHRFTGLPVENMKLLAYGAVMKDDELPLSRYGVRPSTKLRLMGSSKPHVDITTNTKSSLIGEQEAMKKLQRIQDKLDNTFVPEINEYEQHIKSYKLTKDGDSQEKLIQKGLYFAEMLMQLLFEFDGVQCSFDQARHQRKEGVKMAQELLDKVDRLKNSIIAHSI
ncbi:uncharacterized protein BX664DRAFT_298285 [Halteromyces radiatus]|uniref:uncharacterized protein n=1 Tax=Halteromyces radiatus TaxID=101107 RepID=UPI00221FE324|nr:uncharacterized protein BX664DRAFT_298285 [Halteromyces radiatus]KAI8085997.1 hypothetical protein BX664DRAFT_298285 [Halteromyces radiatus]